MKKHTRIVIYSLLVSIIAVIVICLLVKPFQVCEDNKKQISDESLSDTIDYIDEYKFSHPFLAKADSFFEIRMIDSSIYYYHKVLLMLKKFKNRNGILGEINYQIGVNYRASNNPDSAFIYLSKALNIQKKLFGENNFNVAKSYLEIGNIHRWKRYDYYNANKYYEKGLSILEKISHLKKEEYLVRTYYNLATTNRLRGDYKKGLNYGFYTLELANKLNLKVYPEISNSIIANLYMSIQNYSFAIKYFKKAIDINILNNSNIEYLALYYNNLADVYNRLKMFEIAIKYANKSINLCLQNSYTKTLSNSYEFLAKSYIGNGNFSKGLSYLKESLKIRRIIYGEKHPEVANIYKLFSLAYKKKSNLDSALFYTQKAIISNVNNFNTNNIKINPPVDIVQNKFYLIDNLITKADILKKLSQTSDNELEFLKLSLNTYLVSDTLISESKYSYQDEASKLIISRNKYKMYENGVDCAYELYAKTKDISFLNSALRFYEKNKYQLILEKLNYAENFSKINIPDSIKEKERNLQFEIQYIKNNLEKEKDEISINQLHTNLFKVSKEHEKLRSKLEKNYPKYFQTKYNHKSIRFSEIQQYSKNNKTCIIQYFYGDSAIYAISIMPDTSKFIKINLNDTLKNHITQFSELLNYSDVSSITKYKNYITCSYYLYNKLIAPFIIKSKYNVNPIPKKIKIIPDGMLTALPFEAFISTPPKQIKLNYKDIDYLLKHYQISYAYSSSLLLQNDIKTKKYIKKILAFSYSSKNISFSKKSNFRINSLNELKGASKEISFLKRNFFGKFLTGNNSSEDSFKKYAEDFDILHLALHGLADTTSGINTKLVFKFERNSNEDGYLYPYELYTLNLKAKLAVLSACETGIGEFQKGEGVFSMGRAFAFAGCPSLIISLWKVNDKSTSYLMNNFYKLLKKRNSIDYSLHTAKLNYLFTADEYTAHPANWASFIAYGDMSKMIVITKNQFIYYLISILLISIISIYIVYKNKITKPNHK